MYRVVTPWKTRILVYHLCGDSLQSRIYKSCFHLSTDRARQDFPLDAAQRFPLYPTFSSQTTGRNEKCPATQISQDRKYPFMDGGTSLVNLRCLAAFPSPLKSLVSGLSSMHDSWLWVN